MLYKKPKVTKFQWKQLFRNIFYLEAAVFGVSFYVWNKLCKDQNFRLSCHKHCSPLLFGFYKFMNSFGFDYQKIDYKKWGISEELQKREESRQISADLKKKEKQSNKIDDENYNFIMDKINKLKNEIEIKLEEVKAKEPKSVSQQSLNNIVNDYDILNKYVNDSHVYLPSYHLNVAQKTLSTLKNSIDFTKEYITPKSKFSFKKSLVSKPKIDSKAIDEIDSIPKQNMDNMFIGFSEFYGFKNVKNDNNLKLLASEANGKDIELENLEDCVIEIYGAPNTIRVNNLTDCKVFCGPITTSAFISNCKNCVFQVAGQQLRIHGTSNCDIYQHVTSHAIIEDSTKLRFAPYSWSYNEINDHFIIAGLDRTQNNWLKIDDFNWLSTEKSSPNWTFI